jgi:RNA 3'-terminal phosphate cyclase (ATP)
VRFERIRAGRKKPGLMRQHKTCVEAAARVSGARTTGVELGSKEVTFEPAGRFAGDYRFEIATAGSTSLVLQTVLYPLLLTEGTSTVEVTGGTHAAMAPSFTFLKKTFAPVLQAMGAELQLELVRPGYFPAGGGCVRMTVTGVQRLHPVDLTGTADNKALSAVATVAQIPEHVATRELKNLAGLLPIPKPRLYSNHCTRSVGPGNVLHVEVPVEGPVPRTEVFNAYGKPGVRAEAVAADLAKEVKAFTTSGADVSEHLADQLQIPLALAGGGSFTCNTVSQHARTNAEIIERFLDCETAATEIGPERYRLELSAARSVDR